jgi:hypothetical protein
MELEVADTTGEEAAEADIPNLEQGLLLLDLVWRFVW